MEGLIRKYKISLILDNIELLTTEDVEIIKILESTFSDLTFSKKEGYLPSYHDKNSEIVFWYTHQKEDVYIPRTIFERLMLIGITPSEIRDYINYYYDYNFQNCYYGRN